MKFGPQHIDVRERFGLLVTEESAVKAMEWCAKQCVRVPHHSHIGIRFEFIFQPTNIGTFFIVHDLVTDEEFLAADGSDF